MEKKKVGEAYEDSKDDTADVASSGEGVEKNSRVQPGYSHIKVKRESRTHNTKDMDLESVLCIVQEIESESTNARETTDKGRDLSEGPLKVTEPNPDEKNQGGEESPSLNDEGRRLVCGETIEDRILGDAGDSVTKKMARDLFVLTDREVGCEESNLRRDPTRQSGNSEVEGDMSPGGDEDLPGEGGMEPPGSVDGACQPKEHKAETYENFPGRACLAASCPEGSMVDYPYVDYSTNEFMAMCDFVAADDTQLSLSRGDKVLLLNAVTEDWWWVEHNGDCGYVPATHLRGVYDEEDSDVDDPWQDEEYYGSYKTLKLHLEMLSDRPRTQTYRNVIMQNSTALKGKRILDLGCGTGIISFFCAQLAEPEIVYAVEASEIAEQTCKLVDENGYSSIVQVLCQRAEELQLPTKVDVLVSEWMGTCLVFEFMLESVLLARDLWLKEDGVMWPSTACVYLVPCSADQEYASRVLFWDAPYGLDFSVLKPMAIQEFFSRPKPDYVLNPEDCLSQPCTLLDVNMKTLNIEDLEVMNGEFQFHVDRDGTFHGFTAWFSVQFQNIDNQEQVELNTGPFHPLTHWKHTLFMLDKPLQVHVGDRITGSVVFKRNPTWRRHLSVTITWSVTTSSLTPVQDGCKIFPIWR